MSRRQRLTPALSGAVAACAALDLLLVLRVAGAGVFVPEAATEWVVNHTPGSVESGAVALLGGFAKILGLEAAVLAFVAAHAAFALYHPRLAAVVPRRLPRVAILAAAPAAAVLLALLPLFGEGLAGAGSPVGATAAVLSTALGAATFALVLEGTQRALLGRYPAGVDVTRRAVLAGSAAALSIVALALAGLSPFVPTTGRLSVPSFRAVLDGEITPNDKFYVVQKNFLSPAVNPSTWELAVDGLVSAPRTYSSNELLARALHDQVVTLECVSNPVGGGLISSAWWTGVPLAELLGEAGALPAATWVEFSGEDGYTVGVPVARAMGRGALVALYMNGERLPRDHGFPARVLVPGLYGMMNAKWVRRITLVDHEVVGYWQEKGWTNEATIRTSAVIATFPASAPRGRPVTVGGVAFAGDREITRVEVSDDGGATWGEATVRSPLSPYAWTLWEFDWTPASPGRVRLTARAWDVRDGAEVVQDAAVVEPFPSGASGYDSVEVDVT